MGEHCEKLQRMYLSAPCNVYYEPKLFIKEGETELVIEVKEKFFHSAQGVHGSVYFKMLDDAAFFSASSLVRDVFILTASFHSFFMRPVNSGTLIAKGRVTKPGKQILFAESVLYDANGRELAKGSGTFARSEIALSLKLGYQ